MEKITSGLEIRRFATGKILEGWSYQAVFDALTLRIPNREYDLAKAVADIPSLAQRKQYGLLNWLLIGLLLVFAAIKYVWSVQIGVGVEEDPDFFVIMLLLPTMSWILAVLIWTWNRRYYHGVILVVLWGSYQLIRPWHGHGWDALMFVEVGMMAAMLVLSLFIRSKIGGRYRRGGKAKTQDDGRVETTQTIIWLN
jgi:hypothetical protein